MPRLLFALFFVSLVGCAASTTRDASDASLSDAVVRPDASVACTSISRPTGACDLARGMCCASSECIDGICQTITACSGDLGYCDRRDDCCNSRHSCIENMCQY